MMISERWIHRIFRTSAVVLLFLVAGIPPGSAADQQVKSAADDTEKLEDFVIEEIVLTGSLIKRALSDVSQPITILKADDLVRSGATNPEQIMQQIAQNQALHVSNTSIGRGTGGSVYANLRSLGSERTLVLVNGKRIVNGPYQSIGVDLNTVPISLVERVEILADGGSSTYGTDAIAGVVNFITAKELTGLNISTTTTLPEKSGGGETYLARLSGGVGSIADNGWNVYAGASWRKAEELPNTARGFSSTGFLPERGVNNTQDRTPLANYSQVASGITDRINPANPDCDGPFMQFADGIFGPRSCAYDVLARVDLLTPQEQWSVLGKGSLQLGKNQTASLEYVRGDNRLDNIVAPQGPGGLDMTSNNPFYPGQGITPGVAGLDPTLPVRLSWRTEDLGRRQSEVRSFADRTLAELEGRIGTWEYQVSALVSKSAVDVVLTNGYPDEDAIRDGFTGANGAAFLNPFGPQTVAGRQYLESIEVLGKVQSAKGDLKVYGAQVNRQLFSLAGGPIAVAAAVELQDESARFTNNASITSRTPTTFADVQDIRGDRHSRSASVEVNLPVLEDLEVGLAARYDNYSDFGSTTNPELSLRYEPLRWLALRGSYSTSFRAPTLYNLFQPRTLGFTDTFSDPLLCPDGVLAPGGIDARDCSTEFDTNTGGNPNLDAEDSDTYTLGVQLVPLESLAITLDYWNYHLEGTIGALSDEAVFGDPAKYDARIVRCSQVPAADLGRYSGCNFGGGGDPIAYIEATLDNLGDTRTSGFDLAASWTGRESALGRFGVQYRGTYVSKYEFQREPGGEFFRRAGRYFDNSAVLRYMHFLSASWERGAWLAQLTHRYRAGYTDCNDQCDIDPEFFRDVDAFSVFDLSGTYRWNENVTVSATIGNLFNQGPPFAIGTSDLTNNWDDRYADPRLRTYLLTVSWKL